VNKTEIVKTLDELMIKLEALDDVIKSINVKKESLRDEVLYLQILKYEEDEKEKVREQEIRLMDLTSLKEINVEIIDQTDIEYSSGEDKPWFGHVHRFAIWLKKNSKKKYCEWNGNIYNIQELTTSMNSEKFNQKRK